MRVTLKVYTTSIEAVENMVAHWRKHESNQSEINLDIEIINTSEYPELVEQDDIIFSPTILVYLPDQRTFRLVGYTKDIFDVLSCLYLPVNNLGIWTSSQRLVMESRNTIEATRHRIRKSFGNHSEK